MLVVTERADALFLEELQNARSPAENEKCLHLRFGKKIEGRGAEDLATAITKILNDQALRAFFCDDGDVFILSGVLRDNHRNQIFTHLSQGLGLTTLQAGSILFDMGDDRAALIKICQAKQNHTPSGDENVDQERKERERKERERKDILFSPVHPDIVMAIADRRQSRSRVEILIADDDTFSRRLVSNVLEKTYTVHSCSGGQEAILNYVEISPDVVFLDIEMPDVSGLDVLKRIFEFDRDAYVIMLSGHGNRENVVKAVELGAKGFVVKPFKREKLTAYISRSPFVLDKEKKR